MNGIRNAAPIKCWVAEEDAYLLKLKWSPEQVAD
jgi:hypothetical protein